MFVLTIAKTFNTLPLEMAKIVTVLISFLLLTYCQTVIAMSHVKVIQAIKNVVLIPNGVFIAKVNNFLLNTVCASRRQVLFRDYRL